MKKLTKKGIAVITVIAVLFLILIIVSVMYLNWRAYYNEVWQPLVKITDSATCVDNPCYACINDPSSHQIHRYPNIYYLALPEKFKYFGAVCISDARPYDENFDGEQYDVYVFANIGKELSDIQWEISLDKAEGMNTYTGAYTATIDPVSLEVIKETYRAETDVDYIAECEDIIRENIANLKEMYSPYLD